MDMCVGGVVIVKDQALYESAQLLFSAGLSHASSAPALGMIFSQGR